MEEEEEGKRKRKRRRRRRRDEVFSPSLKPFTHIPHFLLPGSLFTQVLDDSVDTTF